jgi:hypothetical protein
VSSGLRERSSSDGDDQYRCVVDVRKKDCICSRTRSTINPATSTSSFVLLLHIHCEAGIKQARQKGWQHIPWDFASLFLTKTLRETLVTWTVKKKKRKCEL